MAIENDSINEIVEKLVGTGEKMTIIRSLIPKDCPIVQVRKCAPAGGCELEEEEMCACCKDKTEKICQEIDCGMISQCPFQGKPREVSSNV